MHIRIQNGQAEKYSVEQLRRDNPGISFARIIPEQRLAEFGVYPLHESDIPDFDSSTHKVVEATPVNVDGTWTQAWDVVELSADELAARAQEVEQSRRLAYQREADPLYFKWQRGEATQQEWLDKIAEIKAAYP